MHWADYVARELIEEPQRVPGDSIIIAAGITPSGEFHIGHLREILTCDLIFRACRNFDWMDSPGYSEVATMEDLQKIGEKQKEAIADNEGTQDFIFIVDSADPLRKVYPFLDDEYEQFIGHQLGNIPPPDENGAPDYVRFADGKGESYSDHFLSPFIEALKQLGVRPRIVDNLECYENGEFAECIDIACSNVEQIRDIITNVSGRELPEDWYPFNPVGSDGSMDGVKVTGYKHPYVSWIDRHGINGQSDIRKGEGKLPWRIDWPAKWAIHGVTCEPFGKDHGAAGGSYDTGKEIAELFNIQAPHPLTYEWISLKGVGAMSSSAGKSIGPLEVLEIVPPEIVRYLITRNQPRRHIDFDTGSSLIELSDEYQRNCNELANGEPENLEDLSKRQQKAWVVKVNQIAYSQVHDITLLGYSGLGWEDEVVEIAWDSYRVSFRHLALLSQLFPKDEDVWKSLNDTGMIHSRSYDLLMERGKENIASMYYIEDAVVHSRDDFDYEKYLGEDAGRAEEILNNKSFDITLEEQTWFHHLNLKMKELGLEGHSNLDFPTSGLPRRLKTIRNWIASPHFPEDFRLRIQTSISQGAKENMDSRDSDYLLSLKDNFENCYWETESINDCICEQARIREIKIRDAFQLLYWIFLDQGFGPKLASILREMRRDDVLNLLQMAIDAV